MKPFGDIIITIKMPIPLLDLENPTNPKNYINQGLIPGRPLNWMDDVTGQLERIMLAFFEKLETPKELETVIKYLQYWIHAPCWLEKRPFEGTPEADQEIKDLRAMAMQMKTRAEVEAFIKAARDAALDPF